MTTLTCFGGCLGPLGWPWVFSQNTVRALERTLCSKQLGWFHDVNNCIQICPSAVCSHISRMGMGHSSDICERLFKQHWRLLLLLPTLFLPVEVNNSDMFGSFSAHGGVTAVLSTHITPPPFLRGGRRLNYLFKTSFWI